MAAIKAARLALGAEVALAFACGLAFFAILSVPLAVADSRVLPAAALGIAAIGAVLAILRLLGIAYAVTATVAGLLAFDWFYSAPTHPHRFPDAESLVDLLVFLAAGALIGVLAASAGRRAATSERARSELAGEQAALRRVATLVAQGVPASRLLTAVAEEAATLLDVDGAWIEFYEGEAVVNAAKWSKPGKDPPTFHRVKLDDAPVAAAVRRSGSAERVDDFESIQPSTARAAKPRPMSLVGAPITVEGRQWGLMLAWSQDSRLPADTEAHLTAFTELLATAIANSDARAHVTRLADQQAALRRVATLVARGVSPDEVFTNVASELGQVLGVDFAWLDRAEDDGTVTDLAFGGSHLPDLPVGRRMPIDGRSVTGLVLQTEQPARIDDYATATGTMAELAQGERIRGAVGCPIFVEGQAWGVLAVATRDRKPLPIDTEARIEEFTQVVATAIANAQARREVAALADEQAALRRVATLVAEGAGPAEVFAAVARELGQLLGVDSTALARWEEDGTVSNVGGWAANGATAPVGTRVPIDSAPVSRLVYESGRPVRLDDYEQSADEVAEVIQGLGIQSSVGAPIIVDGQPWGVMIASANRPEPLPADTESRIAAFGELVATAISNTQARTETRRLADEQAALRRVATLVADSVPPPEVFAAVAQELGQLLGVDSTYLSRYEPDDTSTGVGSWSAHGADLPMGTHVPLDSTSVAGLVHHSGQPARLDNYAHASGEIAEIVQGLGIRSSVGAPISVEGELWGVLIASSSHTEPLPADTESRIAAFSELVATSISNAQARSETRRLADEQAALRRVATLVAEGVPPPDVFAAVAEEVGHILGADSTYLVRYEWDATATSVGSWSSDGSHYPVGTRAPLDGTSVTGLVQSTGRAARLDDYDVASGEIAAMMREKGVRSSIGAPIVVDGQLWGVMAASSKNPQALPADTESRISRFTDLVATAVANTEARTETRRLADEQAALRRVATLAAESVPSDELFLAVVEQVGTLFEVDLATLLRYEDESTATLVSTWTADGVRLEGPRTWSMTEMGLTRTFAQSNWPTRVDDWNEFSGPLAEYVRDVAGVTSSVGSSIIVGGRLWGALAVHSTQEEPVPVGTEPRLGQFTELVATAIANTQARSDLAASRARIVAATDDERRRVVRDLHDGAQQRLVHTVVTLKLASRALNEKSDEGPALVTEALSHAEGATKELRELSHGILPAVLTQGGLRAGVGALATRMPMPVEADVAVARLPPTVEATAYFIVAEALTNVAKHSHASHAVVTARTGNGTLQIQVRDDGVGGAQPEGSGLVGLADRVAAVDGTFRLESTADAGTLVAAEIPVR